MSAIACIYSTLLSLAAIAFCAYVSSQSGGFTLGYTLFPFLAIVLAIGESVCVAKEEGRAFLTKAQMMSFLLLVAGAVVWGLDYQHSTYEYLGRYYPLSGCISVLGRFLLVSAPKINNEQKTSSDKSYSHAEKIVVFSLIVLSRRFHVHGMREKTLNF